MKVIIPDDYQNAVSTLDCYRLLQGHDVTIYTDHVTDTESLAERFLPAEALVLIRERTPITAELLARLPALKLICQTGRGAPHIDIAACSRHGVAVATGSGSPYAPAELTWALVLAAMRHLPQEMARLKRGEWGSTLGTVLRGRTLGIWGYGKIGALVSGYGRAFGMNVLVWGRTGSQKRAHKDGFEFAQDSIDLFRRADVLSVHLKLVDETRGAVSARLLAAMKPAALFVNTSRAGLVEPGALVEALERGNPGFAAVDVYDTEPAVVDPLLSMVNVVCTPHLGYVERDLYEEYFGTAFEQLNAFAAGKPIPVLNAESWTGRA